MTWVIIFVGVIIIIFFLTKSGNLRFWLLTKKEPEKALQFFISNDCWHIGNSRPFGDWVGPFSFFINDNRIKVYGKQGKYQKKQKEFIKSIRNAKHLEKSKYKYGFYDFYMDKYNIPYHEFIRYIIEMGNGEIDMRSCAEFLKVGIHYMWDFHLLLSLVRDVRKQINNDGNCDTYTVRNKACKKFEKYASKRKYSKILSNQNYYGAFFMFVSYGFIPELEKKIVFEIIDKNTNHLSHSYWWGN